VGTWVRCRALRWVDDEPQPGIVEVQLVDVFGVAHTFVEKEPVFGADTALGSDTAYPLPVLMRCEVLDKRIRDGSWVFIITTERPDGVESVDGQTEFEITADQLATSSTGHEDADWT
jgi:hypothetical protein